MTAPTTSRSATGRSTTSRPTTSRVVTFTRPFRLSAMPYRLPPGSYTIETGQREQNASMTGYRPPGTYLRLPLPYGAAGLAPQIMIDATELEVALAHDAAPEPYGPETIADVTAREASSL